MKFNLELTDYEARTIFYAMKQLIPCYWRPKTVHKIVCKLRRILLAPTMKRVIEKRKEKERKNDSK